MQDQKVPARGYETYVRDYFHGMKSERSDFRMPIAECRMIKENFE